MAMSNELLPTGYFQDLLDLLTKPNYESIQSILDETVDALLPSQISSATAISLLTRQINQCQDVYHLMKLLLLLHRMINKMMMGRLFLLEALTAINLNRFHKACCFDVHFSTTILRPYILYLMKLCSSYEVYTFSQKPQKIVNSLYLFGCLNLVKYCWPLLQQLRRYQPILQHTYPFILDSFSLVLKDALNFAATVVQLSRQQHDAKMIDKQMNQMRQMLKSLHDCQELQNVQQETQQDLACEYRQNISDFMNSQKKQEGCIIVWTPN